MKKHMIALLLTSIILGSLVGCSKVDKNGVVDTNSTIEDTNSVVEDNSKKGIFTSKKEAFPPDKEGAMLESGDFINVENFYRVNVTKEGRPDEVRIFFDVNVYRDPSRIGTLKEAIEAGNHVSGRVNSIKSGDKSFNNAYTLEGDGIGSWDYDIPKPPSTTTLLRTTMYIEDKGYNETVLDIALQFGNNGANQEKFYINKEDIKDVSIEEYARIKHNQYMAEYKPKNKVKFSQIEDVTIEFISATSTEDGKVVVEIEATNNSNEDISRDAIMGFYYSNPLSSISYNSSDVDNAVFPLKAKETKIIRQTLEQSYVRELKINPNELVVTARLVSDKGVQYGNYEEEYALKVVK